jgi:hypothetical protein
LLAERREPLPINYLSITPPELCAAWNNPRVRHQLRAMHELTLLAPRTTLEIAVPAFNQDELRRAGYARTVVVPGDGTHHGWRGVEPSGAVRTAPGDALALRRPRRTQQGH